LRRLFAGLRARKEVAAWCVFDFANSSYTTVITTVAFSVFFRDAVVGRADPRADFLWAVSGVVVCLAVIALSPVFGALADYSGRKKRWLSWTVAQTVLGTAAFVLLGPGDVGLAMILYIGATIGFEGGYVFYNAFLPEISTPKTMGRISALAWGCGFIGGVTSLLACIPLLSRPLLDASGAVQASGVAGFRASFVLVAAFFALFSIPTLWILRDRPSTVPARRSTDYLWVGFRRVRSTLTHLRLLPQTALFILAYVFFFGGVNTVIRFSGLFATQTFRFTAAELVKLIIVSNIVAVFGTIPFGWLADRIGLKWGLCLTLLLWLGVALLGVFGQERWTLWVMAGAAGIGMGSTQSIGRAMMAELTPPSRQSEFFGFYTLAGQVGSIVAILLFGTISSGSGDQRLAVLWTMPFFLAGLGLLLLVRPERGRAAARAAEGALGA
jgi:UMF1 family MFS transporter